MNNNGSATSGVAKTYPPQDFGRKLSGRKVLIAIGVLVFLSIVGVELFKQIRWNAYLNRVEPRENFSQMIKDLRKYQKRVKELPVDLSVGAKQRWKWVKEPAVSRTGVGRRGNTLVSRFRHRQYEYLYARLDESTAVLWAVPLWKEDYHEPWWTDIYTGHNEAIKDHLARWKREKQTWFVVIYGDRIRAWQGDFPGPKIVDFEGALEPTGEWLRSKRLTETRAEEWIK